MQSLSRGYCQTPEITENLFETTSIFKHYAKPHLFQNYYLEMKFSCDSRLVFLTAWLAGKEDNLSLLEETTYSVPHIGYSRLTSQLSQDSPGHKVPTGTAQACSFGICVSGKLVFS